MICNLIQMMCVRSSTRFLIYIQRKIWQPLTFLFMIAWNLKKDSTQKISGHFLILNMAIFLLIFYSEIRSILLFKCVQFMYMGSSIKIPHFIKIRQN